MDIGTFKVVPEVLKLLFIFFEFLFLRSFLIGWLFLLLFKIVDLSPGFLPVTVGFLNILLYFTLGIFHFVTKLNQFSEHFDSQGFELSII